MQRGVNPTKEAELLDKFNRFALTQEDVDIAVEQNGLLSDPALCWYLGVDPETGRLGADADK